MVGARVRFGGNTVCGWMWDGVNICSGGGSSGGGRY